MKLGTRKSRLALAQSGMIARMLGPDVVLVGIESEGDRIVDAPLRGPLGKGFFTEALETELRRGTIDLAVHSLKDLPVASPPGLVLAGIPARASAADVLLTRADGFVDGAPALPLRSGASVGCTSPRRQALLRAARPDLDVRDLRGNVTTRVERLRQGRFDAIVLAEAGLFRLGGFDGAGDEGLDLAGLRVVRLDVRRWPGAPGQGALAVQSRSDDGPTRARIERLHHAPTATAVEVERAWLARLGGGCSLPFGAWVDGEEWAFALGSTAGVACARGVGLPEGRRALDAALRGDSVSNVSWLAPGGERLWEETHVGA